jgi:hypothetical protein
VQDNTSSSRALPKLHFPICGITKVQPFLLGKWEALSKICGAVPRYNIAIIRVVTAKAERLRVELTDENDGHGTNTFFRKKEIWLCGVARVFEEEFDR